MLSRLAKYLERTWDFQDTVSALKDQRDYCRIPTSAVFLSCFGLFATRLPSFNAMEIELKLPSRWDPWVGPAKPSADTLGYVLERFDMERLRQRLVWFNHQIKRKKILRSQTPPYLCAALDGHELFSSFKRHCEGCLERTLETTEGPRVQYYHRIVMLQIVNAWPPLILDIEPILPGEGEVAAAERLLERVKKLYPRFFDVLSADALYLGAPFFQKARQLGWHVIVVLKQENRELYQDVEGLLKISQSEQVVLPDKTLKRWDLDSLKTWSQLGDSVRVIVEQGQETKRERVAGKWQQKSVPTDWRWATTLTAKVFSASSVSQWGHGRWDIENRGFNELVNHWAMDHCFHHHPTAILALLFILAMAFILTMIFFDRNLKPEFRQRLKLTRVALARLLRDDLAKPSEGSFWGQPP